MAFLKLLWSEFIAIVLGESRKLEAEERAAIHEHDAGMSRDAAEQLTIREMTRTQRKEMNK